MLLFILNFTKIINRGEYRIKYPDVSCIANTTVCLFEPSVQKQKNLSK